jgi:L-lactate dehydrogenase (cytochrome)
MNARELLALVGSGAGGRSGDRALGRCRNVADVRSLCARRLPRAVFDFVDGAAEDEVTLARNRSAFATLDLTPALSATGAPVSPATTVLGRPVAFPLLLSPCGANGIVHPGGEAAVARAAAAAGTVYTAGCMGSVSLEELADPAARQWFQLYIWRDRGLCRELLARAAAAGYEALVVTVDTPVSGARERDLRSGLTIPPRIGTRVMLDGLRHPRWSSRFVRGPVVRFANVTDGSADPSSTMAYVGSQFDPTVTWDDVATLLQDWSGPVVIKGILSAAEARRAVDAGARAIVVSNHGGRQLDRSPATIDVLPEIAEAVGDDTEIYLDSGVRRGSDLALALARGADACMIGRPYLFGLGAAGEQGVRRVIELLHAELIRTMQLVGAESPAALHGVGQRSA